MRFFALLPTCVLSRQQHWRFSRTLTPSSNVTSLNGQRRYIAAVTKGGGESEVARFYQDRVVFLTGGTGFIGKVLLEKLLRSCPGVKEVYLLIRTKRGQEPQARLTTILSSQVFERLKKEQPGFLEKVKAVSGDLTLPNLGISASDRATVIEQASIVFHAAATVRFDEPLNVAAKLNLLGTRRVLELCRQIQNLSALVHISTAYANCDQNGEIHEAIYQPPIPAESLIEAVECQNDSHVATADGLFFGLPNTYTITKRVAESVLQDERGGIPVAIVRPSIVTAAWKEPFPGWIDSFAASTGFVITLGLGILPTMMVRKECSSDIIPVDIVANMVICAAWHTATTRPEHVTVYHCTSSDFKQHTWGDWTEGVQAAILRYPLPHAIRYPKFSVTTSSLRQSANLWCLCYLPACAGDLALRTVGRKPRFVKDYRKFNQIVYDTRYFTNRSWLFRSDNVKRLIGDLSPKDRQLFGLDISNIDWRSYWEQYILGIRKYLLNAEVDKLPDARRHLKRLYALQLSLKLLLLLLVSRLLFTQPALELGYSMKTVIAGLYETLLNM